LIFDEIDVGVSPKVAEKMGKMLRDISQKVQVIAITHQPFTAFFANKHFLVKKVRPDLALCVEIEGKDRIRELGRMMGIEDEVKVLEVLEGLSKSYPL
jgi:DNA repair protein RecN (Recombination protein N)